MSNSGDFMDLRHISVTGDNFIFVSYLFWRMIYFHNVCKFIYSKKCISPQICTLVSENNVYNQILIFHKNQVLRFGSNHLCSNSLIFVTLKVHNQYGRCMHGGNHKVPSKFFWDIHREIGTQSV